MNTEPHTVNILGIPFSVRDKETTLQAIDSLLNEKTNAKIFTPNPEILYRAKSTPSLNRALRTADILLPDGVGVILASRLTDTPLPCRITGIDTAEHILRVAADKGLSVYLLGGRVGVAERAADKLRKRFSGLRVAGSHHGYFSSEAERTAVAATIKEAAPDILFVCLGSPAQEEFIAEFTPRLPSLRLSMGLGGCLDIWSGDIQRAPKIMQRTGMEWLYRTVREPKRAKRLPYLAGFCCAAVHDRIKKQV